MSAVPRVNSGVGPQGWLSEMVGPRAASDGSQATEVARQSGRARIRGVLGECPGKFLGKDPRRGRTGEARLVSQQVSASQFRALLPNQSLQPTSLPPETFPPIFGRVLGGKAAAERGRWAS